MDKSSLDDSFIIEIIFMGPTALLRASWQFLSLNYSPALPFQRGLLRFLKPGLEGAVLVETPTDCHEDVTGISHI